MLTGAILAGGQNLRMNGQPKALMSFQGEALVQRQIRLMHPVCDEIIVVTNEPKPFLRMLEPSVRIITDYYPHHGPLGGMHAAFTLARREDVWVVGCDMPNLSAEAAQLLSSHRRANGFDAAIPSIGGGLYPLHGVYSRNCSIPALALLRSGETRESALLRDIRWGEIQEERFAEEKIDPRFVHSLKTPEDFRSAQKPASEVAGG